MDQILLHLFLLLYCFYLLLYVPKMFLWIMLQGNAAYKGRQWNKAVTYYTEAINLNETKATYYSNRAAAYLELEWFVFSSKLY